MALTADEIVDIATTTLKELGPPRFNSIAESLVDYHFFRTMMRKEKVTFEGGTGIERKIMVDTSGNARNTGLFATDTINVTDVMKTITIPWRHATTNYAIEKRENLMNMGRSKIVNLIEARRHDAMVSYAELMEGDFWSKPTDSTDEVTPFGLTYWVVKNATEGFNGGNASGFTAGPGGLSASTYSGWKNYTAQYTNFTKDDAITKLRTAARKTKFMSPVSRQDLSRGRGFRYQLFTNNQGCIWFEDVGEAQNDSLGRDVASMDGQITFHRNPVMYVPQLDGDSTNPVYMLDLSQFYPVFLKGDYMRESQPKEVANMHNTLAVHIDTTYNILCTNRRHQTVIYQ